jgi:membrane protein
MLTHTWRLLTRTYDDFSRDRCQSMAAALAYYTAFSLPPLLVLLLLVLGAVTDPGTIRDAMNGQLQTLMGNKGAEQVSALMQQAQRPEGTGWRTALGILALLFGATGVFGELQGALNRTWRVAPDPKQGGLKNFIGKRLFSFTFVIVIAFLLLVSLVLSALISAFGGIVSHLVQGGLSEALLFTLDLALSFAIFTLVFAVTFRFLPDARVAWRDVGHGAVGTAVLFLIGKFAIGFYLGRSNPGEAYGAAGSLAVLLVWLYYSSMILLFGAEFTRVWAEDQGHRIEPERGAIVVPPVPRPGEPQPGATAAT